MTNSEACRVDLGSEPGIRDVAALYGQLRKHVDNAEPVELDGSRVQRVDTAVIQLVLCFVADRKTRALPTVVHGRESILFEATRLLGLDQQIPWAQGRSDG